MAKYTLLARKAAVLQCPKGHLYDAANTYIFKGSRHCRACHREAEIIRRKRVSIS